MAIDDIKSFNINVIEEERIKKWVVAYGNSLDTQDKRNYIAQHFDLIDTGFNNTSQVSNIKTINPNILAIGYKGVQCIYGPGPFQYPDWEECNQHEDWFLHNLQNSRIKECNIYNSYFMNNDPSVGYNIHWANYALSKLQNECSMFDGVFADNNCRFMGQFGCSDSYCVCDDNGNPISLSQIPSNVQINYPFNGDVVQGNWQYEATATKMGILSDYIFMGNSGSSWDLSDNLNMWICVEGMTGGPDKWGTPAYTMHVFNQYLSGINYDTVFAAITSCSLDPIPANRDQIHQWFINNYCFFTLVIGDPNKSYFCFQNSYSSPYQADPGIWFSEIDTILGEPLDTAHHIPGNPPVPSGDNGVYVRHFEHKIIARNLGWYTTYVVNIDGTDYTFLPDEGKII